MTGRRSFGLGRLGFTCLAFAVLWSIQPAVGAEILTGRASIVDGDTIRLGSETIRLDGIDAPEIRQECEDGSGRPYPCGIQSSRHLASLTTGRRVSCTVTGRDAYDRSLGVCSAGGAELNALMVRSGWALAFRRYSDRYVPEERRAEAAKLGMWAGSFDPPWDWRAGIVAEAAPGDCVIKGNISRSGERIYHMPFQRDYDRTRINEAAGERWFCTEDEALAAGWRRAGR